MDKRSEICKRQDIPEYVPYKGDKEIVARGQFQQCTIDKCRELIFQEGRCLDHWLIFDKNRTCEVKSCKLKPLEDHVYCGKHLYVCSTKGCYGRGGVERKPCDKCVSKARRKKVQRRKPKCEFNGCNKPRESKGLCSGHRKQRNAGKTLTPLKKKRRCLAYQCDRKTEFEYCAAHRKRIAKGQTLEPIRTPQIHCKFEGCNKPHQAKGYCSGHYTQLRRGQTLKPIYQSGEPCRFQNCRNLSRSLGYCQAHYRQHKEGKELYELPEIRSAICKFDSCKNPHTAKGYCSAHYQQLKRGVPLSPIKLRGVQTHCKVIDCDKPLSCNGFCSLHNNRYKRGKTCLLECRNPKFKEGLCKVHFEDPPYE